MFNERNIQLGFWLGRQRKGYSLSTQNNDKEGLRQGFRQGEKKGPWQGKQGEARDIERGRGRGAQLSAFLPITSPSDTDIVPPLLASTLKTEKSGVGRKTQRGKRDYKRFTKIRDANIE